jgi:VanZ family protein
MFFIWYRSTLSAVDSTVESTSVLTMFDDIFKWLGFNVELTDFIVRKSAHFCEFALLGCLVIWTFYLFTHKILKNFTSVGFICLATATADEIIQIYSPGRSCQVTDVVLDFSGAVAGVIFFLLIFSIYKIICKNKGRKR